LIHTSRRDAYGARTNGNSGQGIGAREADGDRGRSVDTIGIRRGRNGRGDCGRGLVNVHGRANRSRDVSSGIHGLPAKIRQLRDLGFRIALDDLGAGYAGLSSFAMLEPEVVKVDMSLVRGIHQSPTKQKLFRSFASLCQELNTELIAEGVESAEERDCLNALGGDLYQGYLFARPGRGFPSPRY